MESRNKSLWFRKSIRKVFFALFICIALTGLAWADAYSEAVIADSPLSYFQFEDAVSADGNSCADTMGLTAAYYRNIGSGYDPISLVAGRHRLGQAVEFNGAAGGSGNFVDVHDNVYTGDLLTDANMTIEMWMSTTASSSNYPVVVDYHNYLDGAVGPQLKFGNYAGPPVQTFQPFIEMDGGTWYAWPPGILGDGDWHHYAVTFDFNSVSSETTAEIFIDGESQGTHAFSGQIVPTSDPNWATIILGAAGNEFYVSSGYEGLMDEVAIYDYALSGAQIAAHYNAEVNNVDAPAAPTGLEATDGDSLVLLDWNDNSEADVNGYNVYRSTTSGSGYVNINDTLLTDSNYVDNDGNLVLGTTYYYVVTAVDNNDYESDYSSEASGIPADLFTRTFVYKYKSTKWCYDYDSNDSNWVDSRSREQGYFIIDVNYGLACQIAWDSRSLTYQRVYDGNFSAIMELVDGRSTWLFSQFGSDSNDYSLMVQGRDRTSTIAGTALEVARSLKGTSINNFGSDPRYIEMGKATLRLDTDWTELSIGNHLGCSLTEAAIIADLNDAGYTELTDLTELASDSNYFDLVTPDVNVLVYNCSERGNQYSDSGGPWLRGRGTDKFFLVIDVNSGEYTRIDYDRRAGTYEETTSGTYDVLGIQGVRNTSWVILGLDSDSAMALSGKTRTRTLGTQTVTVASRLKGYLTYNQGTSPQYIGDKTITCSLYRTLSIEAIEGSYTLSEAVDAVKALLDNIGYTEL